MLCVPSLLDYGVGSRQAWLENILLTRHDPILGHVLARERPINSYSQLLSFSSTQAVSAKELA